MMGDDAWDFEFPPHKRLDRVDVTATSPQVDWTPNDAESRVRHARGLLEVAARNNNIASAEAALAQWRKYAFKHGDEKVEG